MNHRAAWWAFLALVFGLLGLHGLILESYIAAVVHGLVAATFVRWAREAMRDEP